MMYFKWFDGVVPYNISSYQKNMIMKIAYFSQFQDTIF